MRLAELSWAEAQRVLERTDTVILPVGSTEQHGPHCPLGTDHVTADAVANMVGDRAGLPVLPVVPVGVSSHHRQFHGTLWAPPAVFRDYVKAVILSAASHGPGCSGSNHTGRTNTACRSGHTGSDATGKD